MEMTVHSGPPFPRCAARQDLLSHEQLLRSDAKLGPERRRAALLANAALNTQKERHRHEESCLVCRRTEPQGDSLETT
jgi:hypothetical protein